MRFEAVSGEDQRRTQQLFQKTPGQVCVPRMAVNDICIVKSAQHHDVANESVSQFLVTLVSKKDLKRRCNSFNCHG